KQILRGVAIPDHGGTSGFSLMPKLPRSLAPYFAPETSGSVVTSVEIAEGWVRGRRGASSAPTGAKMARPQSNPLRPLTAEERTILEQTARSRSEPAARVARARILLALAEAASFAAAAQVGGFRSGYGVAQLVRRFNRDGLLAVAG